MQQSSYQSLSHLYKTQSIQKLVFDQIDQIPTAMNKRISLKHKDQLHITVSFPKSSNDYHFLITSSDVIDFVIILGKGYPIYSPKIHLLTQITQPAINDARDLNNEIIASWNIRMTLSDIISLIPKFLIRLHTIKQQLRLQKIGKFQLGRCYDYAFLNILGSHQYIAFHIQGLIVRMFVITQTDTHFLIFITKQQPTYQNQKLQIPSQQHITQLTLVFVAQIQSITQIKISRQQHSQFLITFNTIKTRNLQLETVATTKKFKINKGFNMVERILRNVRRYQPIKMEFETSAKDNEQQRIILNIQKQQQTLQQYLNQNTIEQLNKAYQQAVEYYSVANLPYYEIYLAKISNLYSRKDIKLILGLK